MAKDIEKLAEIGEKFLLGRLENLLSHLEKGSKLYWKRNRSNEGGRDLMVETVHHYKKFREEALECGLDIIPYDKEVQGYLDILNKYFEIPISIEDDYTLEKHA